MILKCLEIPVIGFITSKNFQKGFNRFSKFFITRSFWFFRREVFKDNFLLAFVLKESMRVRNIVFTFPKTFEKKSSTIFNGIGTIKPPTTSQFSDGAFLKDENVIFSTKGTFSSSFYRNFPALEVFCSFFAKKSS